MVGASIALSGVAMVLLAGELGSVALVQWHWTIGNTVGLFVVLFMLLREHGPAVPLCTCRRGLAMACVRSDSACTLGDSAGGRQRNFLGRPGGPSGCFDRVWHECRRHGQRGRHT